MMKQKKNYCQLKTTTNSVHQSATFLSLRITIIYHSNKLQLCNSSRHPSKMKEMLRFRKRISTPNTLRAFFKQDCFLARISQTLKVKEKKKYPLISFPMKAIRFNLEKCPLLRKPQLNHKKIYLIDFQGLILQLNYQIMLLFIILL